MDNKRVDAARIVLKCFGLAAAVFALIGSIGCLVSVAELNSLSNMSPSTSAGLQTLNVLMSLVRNYDFARVGALIILGFASTLAVLDKASGNAERGVSIFTSTMAAFGFGAVFMTSLAISYALLYAEESSASSQYGGLFGSSLGVSTGSQASGASIRVIYMVAMILIMLSALAMIISLIYSIYRVISLKAAARNYADQQYAQQYAQQYLQQQYPQQGYPQQQYPQYPQNPQYPGQDQNNNTGV